MGTFKYLAFTFYFKKRVLCGIVYYIRTTRSCFFRFMFFYLRNIVYTVSSFSVVGAIVAETGYILYMVVNEEIVSSRSVVKSSCGALKSCYLYLRRT